MHLRLLVYSLTDIAKYKSDDPTAVIQNWMRGRDVIEFLGLWEQLHNPNFKPIEFEGFKNKAGANAFTMSPKKWIESTLKLFSFYYYYNYLCCLIDNGLTAVNCCQAASIIIEDLNLKKKSHRESPPVTG